MYLQFGLRDYMPTHLVYNLENFLFDLHEFDGETSSGVGSTTALRSSCGARMQMEIGQGVQLK